MNERQFRRLFPAASDSTVAVNCEIRSAEPEHNPTAALDGATPRETQSVARPVVRFTCVRKRLLDPDNNAGSVKDLLDGLRHGHLIRDDSCKHIELQTTQRKTLPNEEEHTLIEIYYP